jgi:hypothetical protein
MARRRAGGGVSNATYLPGLKLGCHVSWHPASSSKQLPGKQKTRARRRGFVGKGGLVGRRPLRLYGESEPFPGRGSDGPGSVSFGGDERAGYSLPEMALPKFAKPSPVPAKPGERTWVAMLSGLAGPRPLCSSPFLHPLGAINQAGTVLRASDVPKLGDREG